MPKKQCCGTCAHWDKPPAGKSYGRCAFTPPISFIRVDIAFTRKMDGYECPCWKAKEAANA